MDYTYMYMYWFFLGGGGNILGPGFVCQNGKFGTWPGHLLNWTMEHKLFSFVDIFIVRSNSLGRGI